MDPTIRRIIRATAALARAAERERNRRKKAAARQTLTVRVHSSQNCPYCNKTLLHNPILCQHCQRLLPSPKG